MAIASSYCPFPTIFNALLYRTDGIITVNSTTMKIAQAVVVDATIFIILAFFFVAAFANCSSITLIFALHCPASSLLSL